jgi:hypothetical protein
VRFGSSAPLVVRRSKLVARNSSLVVDIVAT